MLKKKQKQKQDLLKEAKTIQMTKTISEGSKSKLTTAKTL
jgi:hypothetical protein